MKSSFHESFEGFRVKYAKDRGIIMATTSINNKASTDLKQEYASYLNYVANLTRLNYVANSSELLSIKKLLFSIKGVQPMPVSKSMKSFTKPNHKDRFSYMHNVLTSNPFSFAQIVYLYLVSTDVDEDDKTFYMFSTLPTMYSYFIKSNDQINALEFIKSMFKVHFIIHKANFSLQHQFLSKVVFSFFLATNPNHYFNIVLKSLVREMKSSVENISMNYSMHEGKLIRTSYWQICIKFANNLIKRLIQFVTLLPDSARYLMSEICKIKTNFKAFAFIFAFDSTICQYLENHALCAESELMRDVCFVIRTKYPLQHGNSDPVSTYIRSKDREPNILQEFLNKIQIDKPTDTPDSISYSISICENGALFSLRDLTVSYNVVKKAMDAGAKFPQLNEVYTTIAPPTSNSDEELIFIKAWGVEPWKLPEDMRKTQAFDDTVDGLSMVNGAEMKYKDGSELSSASTDFCGCLMTWMQRLRISTKMPYVKTSDLDGALDDVHKNQQLLEDVSKTLFSSFYFIQTEKTRVHKTVMELTNSVVIRQFLPALEAAFPVDFDFTCKDVFHAKAVVEKVFAALEKHIIALKLPKDAELMASKAVFGRYYDSFESSLGFQRNAFTEKSSQQLENALVELKSVSLRLPVTTQEFLGMASNLFCMIKLENPPTVNLGLLLDGMRLLKNADEEVIMLSIAQTRSTAVIGFHNFLRGYLMDKRIEDLLYTEDEKELVKKFNSAFLRLRNQK